jgi:hypothetical protein
LEEYRGYLLIPRLYPGTSTDRIKRPDGTWRYSVPTIVCGDWLGWVIARRLAGGAVEELEYTATEAEARRRVDAMCSSR